MSATATSLGASTEKVSFCSTKLLGAWTEVDRDAAPSSHEAKAFEDMQRFLAEMLRCEQLIVLSGLGTSLGVVGAPTMGKLWDACEKLGGADFVAFCSLCNYPLAAAKTVELSRNA